MVKGSEILLSIMFLTTISTTFSLMAQENNVTEKDTVHLLPPDSLNLSNLSTLYTQPNGETPQSPFKPISKRSVIYSAVFPGLGQIYNRKYWKLPLVYGGFMGFLYAVSWNNKNYNDYSDAYYYIVKDNPDNPESWDQSWQSFVPAGRDPAEYIRDTNFKNHLKNGKDFYRRYRDLSIILTVGWYLICVADAYVDAQLFDFDISDNLSMRITPALSPKSAYHPSLYGIHCSIHF